MKYFFTVFGQEWFLVTNEGGALPIQKETIIKDTDEDTWRSCLYTGKTYRSTHNKLHDLWDR